MIHGWYGQRTSVNITSKYRGCHFILIWTYRTYNCNVKRMRKYKIWIQIMIATYFNDKIFIQNYFHLSCFVFGERSLRYLLFVYHFHPCATIQLLHHLSLYMVIVLRYLPFNYSKSSSCVSESDWIIWIMNHMNKIAFFTFSSFCCSCTYWNHIVCKSWYAMRKIQIEVSRLVLCEVATVMPSQLKDEIYGNMCE